MRRLTMAVSNSNPMKTDTMKTLNDTFKIQIHIRSDGWMNCLKGNGEVFSFETENLANEELASWNWEQFRLARTRIAPIGTKEGFDAQ